MVSLYCSPARNSNALVHCKVLSFAQTLDECSRKRDTTESEKSNGVVGRHGCASKRRFKFLSHNSPQLQR